MARIYHDNDRPAPSANKAAHPAVETKADAPAPAEETTAAAPAATADKGRGRPKKDDSE